MREVYRVTYDIVTPESAEDGDVAESGYASPGGWQHEDPADLSLRDAIRACGLYDGRGSFEDRGRSFTTYPESDFRTAAETTYTIHVPDTITRASYRRLARYLTGRAR